MNFDKQDKNTSTKPGEVQGVRAAPNQHKPGNQQESSDKKTGFGFQSNPKDQKDQKDQNAGASKECGPKHENNLNSSPSQKV